MCGSQRFWLFSPKFFVVLCVLVLQAAGIEASKCRAEEAPTGNFIFILDASGSMGAQVKGRTKIDVAKEVLSGLVKDLSPSAGVGLVAYGHRQKGDCADVEELAPLAPVNKEALVGKIRRLRPRGMTPITYSVRKAAAGLKGRRDETTIVLISDGEETCKGDPCALVRELRASGIRFVMHVIGFGVAEKDRTQLACIANAGGGFYFSARNAGELGLAAKKAVKKVEKPEGSLVIKALRNGTPFRAYCEVVPEGEETRKKEKVRKGWTENGSAAFQLAPGFYDVKVENQEDANRPTVHFRAILMEPGKEVEKVADFSGGTLKIKAFRNGVPMRAYSTVYAPGGNEAKEAETVTEGWSDIDTAGFKLTPGRYALRVENREDANRPSVNFQDVTIEAGKNTEKVAEFFGGSLKVRALRNEKPFRALCILYKAGSDEDNEKAKVTEGWTEAEGTTFKLTPGVYDVIVENQEDANGPTVHFQGITIEAGKSLEKIADFSGGTLKVTALKNGRPFSAFCRIILQGNGEEVATAWTGGEGTALRLEPGTYNVVVEDREDAGRPTVNFAEITIEAGQTVHKKAEFSGGTLTVKAFRNSKPFSAYCEVFAAGEEGEPLTGDWTEDEGAVFELLPGTYDLVVEDQGESSPERKEFKEVEVKAGTVQTIDVRF